MVSRLYNEHGEQLVKEGKIPMATIDEAVRRVLRIKYRLGLFDHPYADEGLESTTLLSAAHLAAARELAARSFVLLKNDHETLPMSRQLKSIAVIGPLADDPQSVIGPWSGESGPQGRRSRVRLAGIHAKLPAATKFNYARGCEVTGDSRAGFDQSVKRRQGIRFCHPGGRRVCRYVRRGSLPQFA